MLLCTNIICNTYICMSYLNQNTKLEVFFNFYYFYFGINHRLLKGLQGQNEMRGLFWRWRLRQGLFVICARQAIHPSSSQPKKGWSQKLAVSAQQQSRRAVKAERN